MVDFSQLFSGIKNPIDAINQGILSGQAQFAGNQVIQQNERIAEQNKAKADQQVILNAELLALSENENRTADDFTDFIIKHPDLADKFKQPLADLNEAQKQNELSEAVSVYAALESGNSDLAIDILTTRKNAAKNSGDDAGAQQADIMIKTIELNPEAATATAGLFLAATVGPDKFGDMFGKIKPVVKPITPQSAIGKLTQDFKNKLITKVDFEAQKKKINTLPKGMQLSVGPNGEILFTQGEVGGDQLVAGKPTRAKIEASLLSIRARLDRMDLISQTFKPEFLQVGTRIGTTFLALKEKFNLGTLTDEDRTEVSEMAEFRREAFNDLNQTLKEMSGAAINPSEAERLKNSMPDPGTGVFDGDSPTEFIAKRNGIIRDLNRAQARLSHALREGVDFSSIPLSSIDGIIAGRRKELQDSGMSEEEVTAKLKLEFGL